jgi:hypothetical protein
VTIAPGIDPLEAVREGRKFRSSRRFGSPSLRATDNAGTDTRDVVGAMARDCAILDTATDVQVVNACFNRRRGTNKVRLGWSTLRRGRDV